MIEKEEKVLNLIKAQGPLLPIQIAKALGLESYLASAILSTLYNKKQIKMSNKKIGASQLYYVEGQEEKVRQMLFNELNDLEKKTLERIKELKVAFPEDLYPQERFLLNELKDFVQPLKIRLEDGKEISCWKFYSVSEEELKKIIDGRLRQKQKKEEIKEDVVKKEEKPKVKRIRKKVNWDEILNGIKETYNIVVEAELFSKNNEYKAIVKTENKVGPNRFLLVLLNKKITKKDLSAAYVEGLNFKLPVIIIPKMYNEKLENYVKENFGEFLKVLKN